MLSETVEEKQHVLFGCEAVKDIAGPPIHGVASRHQPLVVLHEFTVPNDQLSVVPDLFDARTNGHEISWIVNAQETPVIKNHPRPFCLIAWRDSTRFSGAFNFHLCPDGDEVVKRQHRSGVGGRRCQS